MDTGMDAGPSGQKESPPGDTVIDAAEGYEPQNIRGSREQSAGSRAPSESVTGDTAINSAGLSQLDDATRPKAADEKTKARSRESLSGNSESSSRNVAGSHANDGESMDQAARPAEPDPAHQDGAAAQENEAKSGAGAGAEAGVGRSSGPTGDSVIDIDGSQGPQFVTATTPWGPRAWSNTKEKLQAYWCRLQSAVDVADWEEYFNPSEGSLGDHNECLLGVEDGTDEWYSFKQCSSDPSVVVGFNIGLVSILHLGAQFNIDPEFFRGDIMNRVRRQPVISNSEYGICCHLTCWDSEPLSTFSTDRYWTIPACNVTYVSIYWSKRSMWRLGPRTVLALIRNSKVVEFEGMKEQNFIRRMAWKSYKKALSTAFESREAATAFSTVALEADSSRRLGIAENREIARYLLGRQKPSQHLPIVREPLRFARFMMDWLSGPLRKDVLPSISLGDVALLQRFPTQASLDPLCCSMNLEFWQYTTALLEQEAALLAEQALLEPTFATFRSVNQCRQLVNSLVSASQQSDARRSGLKALCLQRKSLTGDSNTMSDLQHRDSITKKDFDNEARLIQDKLASLESRLKETFTLLVQAVTVVDSDANKKAASQGTLLTLLAALYLPATLATGIFGMNVKLFTDDANAADWRPVIYTFLVVLAPSVAFIGYVFFPKRKQRKRKSDASYMAW